MSKIRNSGKIVTLILFLSLLWGGFWFAIVLLKTVESNTSNFIPTNADFVMQIDGNQVLSKGISSVLFESQDIELVKMVRDLVKSKGDTKTKDLGIAFNSEIVLFTISDSVELQGILVNLNDIDQFKKNISSMLTANQQAMNWENVGLILTETTKLECVLSQKQLLNRCAYYLSQDAHKDFSQFSRNKQNSSMLKTWFKGTKSPYNSTVSTADFSLEIEDKQIIVDGKVALTTLKENDNKVQALVPKGLHFTSRIISQEINDSLRTFFDDSLPNLSSISINYYSTEFVEEPSFFIVPNADVLVQFLTPISIKEILNHNEYITDLNAYSFKYGTIVFNYRQIDAHTVYIGRHKYDNKNFTSISDMVILKGRHDVLTKLEGKGMMMRLIQISTFYNSCKDFIDHINSFEFVVHKPTGSNAEITGLIQFEQEYFAFNELLKFAIRGHFIQ